MTSSLNLLVIDGKKVIHTASVSATAKGQPVHIKAVDGAKYLLSSGDNQAAPEHMLVKRVGKDLQIFSEDGDTTPAAIVDGFYDHQGELSGLAADGTYHTYINQDGSDRDAFLLLDDNGTSTLILGDATSGLDGLSLASGLSTTAIAVGALAALAALAGVVAAASGHHGGEHHSDPTPPTPTGGMAMDHVGSVQGKILAGGVTDDPRPQLSGVATANSLVRIYDNGQLIGSARAAADGSWTFKPEKALAEGSHSLTYSATLDGHESAQSAPIGFTVDTTPPDAPATAHVTDGNGQNLSTGGLTNNGNLNMSGRGVAGDVVKIWDGATLIGSGVVGADGNWNVPVVVVGDGEHDLSASFTDPAGNESAKSAPVAVELDTTAPSAPAVGELTDGNGLDLSAGGLTSNGDLNMSGRGAVPGDLVKIWDGATLIGSGVVGADGSWNVPVVVVGDGEHDLSASFTDPAGNQSARSAPLPVNLDTTAPDAPVGANLIDGNGKSLSGGDGLTNNGDLVMSGSGAAPGDVVKIWDGESLIGSSIVGPDGSWRVPVVVVGDGDHNLSASFTDPAGNESAKSAPIAVDLDTTAPGAPAAGSLTDGNSQDLSHGGLTNSGEMNMSGTGGTAGDTVNLYDGDTLIGTATVGTDGSWTLPAEISGDRVHDLSTSYTDPAGNESARSAPIAVDLDTTAPDAPAAGSLIDGNAQDLSAGGLTNSPDMNMSGSGGTAGDTVNLYDGDTLIGSATVGVDGSWTIPAELAGDRTHELTTSYTDPAGNESAKSAPIAVDLDTTPPDAPAAGSLTDGNSQDLSHGGLTNSGEMNMSGSGGSAGDTVNLYDGDTLIGSAIVEADGSWTIPATITGDTAHSLTTSYTDPAGNESAKSAPIAVDLDTTAPDAPTAASLTDGNSQDLSRGGLTNSGEMNMSGSGGTAGDTVNLYDGDTLIGSAIVEADGSWTIPATITGDTTHNLTTSYTDPAGNESSHSAPIAVNLDTTAPTTTLVLDNNTPALSGVTEGDAWVTIYNGTDPIGSVQANGSGIWHWSPTGAVADGTYQYNVVVKDLAGNVSEPTDSLGFKVASTLWNLDNGAASGWTPGAAYARDTTFTNWDDGRFNAETGSGNFSGDVLSQNIQLIAGHTYTFSFEGISISDVSHAILGVTLNDATILSGVATDSVASGAKVYTITFVADHDGPAKIAITNANSSGIGNDFAIDNIRLHESGPTDAHVTSMSSISSAADDAHSLLMHMDNAVIDLSQVVDNHQGEHTISLESHGNNTLNVSIHDVLALGSEDLFHQDGNKQLLIKGDAGDVVNLESINGDHAPEQWNAQGQVTHDGTTYNVYQNVDHEVEVLIQQGVQTHLQ